MSKFDFITSELQPVDEAEAQLFAEEDFVADIQLLLHNLIEQKGVSRARIPQIFSDDNLNVRTPARIFHALGGGPGTSEAIKLMKFAVS